ncbi:aldo/keto reductase [Mesorhizobium sp. B3-1-7]|uniref:aldo/keto reductase n=1 Tax=Mesorhizobium sp. B3-1-7 TaxID=2589894 RepID=UPI001128D838|nr:aldo/keto reductase [Mesorhizobium sp. B3-1-7]TPI51935.1 aldo/keto reductase [Mesorhizobium sp. B3-1-7]
MDYTKLGRTGLEVSRLCLGCMSYGQATTGYSHPWALGEQDGRTFIKRALDLGINFFDTANNYQDGESEAVLGRAIRDFAPRDEVILATKVAAPVQPGPNGRGLSRKAILSEVDKSLKRLCTDYIDLYQIHIFDNETPLEETLSALSDVVRAGKVRYLGACNLHAWQLMKAIGLQRANGWPTFISIQNLYNLLNREEEREMLPLCLSEGVGANPWSPLARGRLTRPWADEPITERAKTDAFSRILFDRTAAIDKPIVDRLTEVAQERGLPASQIALAWMLRNPAIVSPIVGATKINHLDDAVAALSIELSSEEIHRLEELYQPHPLPPQLT